MKITESDVKALIEEQLNLLLEAFEKPLGPDVSPADIGAHVQQLSFQNIASSTQASVLQDIINQMVPFVQLAAQNPEMAEAAGEVLGKLSDLDRDIEKETEKTAKKAGLQEEGCTGTVAPMAYEEEESIRPDRY